LKEGKNLKASWTLETVVRPGQKKKVGEKDDAKNSYPRDAYKRGGKGFGGGVVRGSKTNGLLKVAEKKMCTESDAEK